MDRLAEAREMVVEDPEILSGAPVIKGTRVPVYHIAAVYKAGAPITEILRSYPSVKEWQVKLALVYASAFPQPPKLKQNLPQTGYVKVISRKRKLLASSINQSGEIDE